MSRATSMPRMPGNMLTRISPVPSGSLDAFTTRSDTTIGRCFSLDPGLVNVAFDGPTGPTNRDRVRLSQHERHRVGWDGFLVTDLEQHVTGLNARLRRDRVSTMGRAHEVQPALASE